MARADEAMLADVKAAAGGDGEAYRRIIDRYQDTIARRMVRFTRDPRMIEELVHDVFVEAYFGLGGYRGTRRSNTGCSGLPRGSATDIGRAVPTKRQRPSTFTSTIRRPNRAKSAREGAVKWP